MKSILLHVGDDQLFESRLQAALDLTRHVGGHLECLQTRRIPAFLGADAAGFAGSAAMMMQLVEDENRYANEEREKLSARLSRQVVPFTWTDAMGEPTQALSDRSLLADCVVLSIPNADTPEIANTLPGVVTGADAAVLAVPPTQSGIDFSGPALIAWKPTVEAATALKASIPLLSMAQRVDIVTVDQADSDFPATDVASYLSRHNISVEIHERQKGSQSTSDVLMGTALEFGSSFMVMGGYGRSRAMEFLLGGVTRRLLAVGNVPLFMAH